MHQGMSFEPMITYSKLWLVTINSVNWDNTNSTFLVGIFGDKKSADAAAANAKNDIKSKFKYWFKVHVREIDANMSYSVFKPDNEVDLDGVMRLDAYEL